MPTFALESWQANAMILSAADMGIAMSQPCVPENNTYPNPRVPLSRPFILPDDQE